MIVHKKTYQTPCCYDSTLNTERYLCTDSAQHESIEDSDDPEDILDW